MSKHKYKDRYDAAKADAAGEALKSFLLPNLLATGHKDELIELARGLYYLAFEVVERLTTSHKRRLELLAIMYDSMVPVLASCRSKGLSPEMLPDHLRREFSNVLKQEAEEHTWIKDKHHGGAGHQEENPPLRRRVGQVTLKDGTVIPNYDNSTLRNFRKDRIGKWRKPRGEKMEILEDDERERRRSKNGWYEQYVERATAALKQLGLTSDEAEILRLAADGNSPEEIVKMTKWNSRHVDAVLSCIRGRLAAVAADREHYARVKRSFRPARNRFSTHLPDDRQPISQSTK
jgi:hypothetical protein